MLASLIVSLGSASPSTAARSRAASRSLTPAVIAPSFGDIFRTNSLKIGLLPVELPQESVRALMDAVLDDPTTRIVVDLEGRSVGAPGVDESFPIDDFTRWRLMEGLDEIGLTLQHGDEIAAYEAARPSWLPTA